MYRRYSVDSIIFTILLRHPLRMSNKLLGNNCLNIPTSNLYLSLNRDRSYFRTLNNYRASLMSVECTASIKRFVCKYANFVDISLFNAESILMQEVDVKN